MSRITLPLLSGSRVVFPGSCLLLLMCIQSAAAGQTTPSLAGLPMAELGKVYQSFRFENVTQAEAEALFGSAVAAVYWPERREVSMLSADKLAFARTYLTAAAQRELGPSAAIATRGWLQIDSKVAEAGAARLGTFLSEVAAATSPVTRGTPGEQYIAKVPDSRPPSEFASSEPVKKLPVEKLNEANYIYQDFEGDVWSYWNRTDNTGGLYTWGIRSCEAYSGSYSANAPRGGAQGASLGCTASYPPSIDIEMSSEACAAIQPGWLAYIELRLKGLMDANDADDIFSVRVAGPDGTLWGWSFYGNWSSRWYKLLFNARQWRVLGDLAANYCNTLHLGFRTDSETANSGWGVAVDDLYIRWGDYVSSSECSVIADPTTGAAPLTVHFRPATDMYSPTYYWRFGDGASSEDRDPVHTYYSPGRYEAYVRLWSQDTACYASRTIQVLEGTCTYQLSPTSASYPATGGTGSVGITASAPSCAWQAVSNNAWISVTGPGAGTGSGTVSYSVGATSSSTARTGTLTIAGQTFAVTQAGFTCAYSLEPSSAAYEAGGGSGKTTVRAATGCNWSAASQVDWLTVTAGASGSGDGSVSYSVAANTSPSSRSGTISVSDQILTVTQVGLSCSFQISPSTLVVPASGGTWTVSVAAGNLCAWAASSAATWIHIVPPDSGIGQGSVSLTVDPNAGVGRTGSFAIQGQVGTVEQAGATTPCAFAYWVPVVSHASGANNSQWRTDLGLLSRGAASTNVELTLYTTAAPVHRQMPLAPWTQAIINNAARWISSQFSGTGALRICSGEPLAVTSRTYNLVAASAACHPGGTFGQFYAAFQERQTLGTGETAWLPGLSETRFFRCNIGLVNTGTSVATVRVTLRNMLGIDLTSYEVVLDAGQLKQENRPFFTKAGKSDLERGYAKVEVIAGSGVVAYASIVDNSTNDPVTIPMEK